MAVDPTQLLADAACILTCVPQGMVQAAQLGQMAPATIVTTNIVGQTGSLTPSILLAANPKRRRAVLQNLSAGNPIFIGGPNVTNTTGFQLFATGAGGSLSQLTVFTQGEIYQISGAVGQNISIMEFLVA